MFREGYFLLTFVLSCCSSPNGMPASEALKKLVESLVCDGQKRSHRKLPRRINVINQRFALLHGSSGAYRPD